MKTRIRLHGEIIAVMLFLVCLGCAVLFGIFLGLNTAPSLPPGVEYCYHFDTGVQWRCVYNR